MQFNDMFTEEGKAYLAELEQGTSFDDGMRFGILATFGSLKIAGFMAVDLAAMFNNEFNIKQFFEAVGTTTLEEYMDKFKQAKENK